MAHSKRDVRLHASQPAHHGPDGPVETDTRHMTGHISAILLNASLLTLPMTALSAVLLGIVFHYRVEDQVGKLQSLALPSGHFDEAGIYYVRVNVTLLLLVASWSSTLANLLAASMVALVCYPIAKGMIRAARLDETRKLPTPYQLAIMLNIIDGAGTGSLLKWLKYLALWRRKREHQGVALVGLATVLVLATCLSFVVFLADTWLHVTTKTVPFLQTQALSPAPAYGFALSSNCTAGNNSFDDANQYNQGFGPCTLNIAGDNTYLINGSRAISVLNNASDTIMVGVFQSDIPYAYLVSTPSAALAMADFTTSTFGMHTQCTPISVPCNLVAFDGPETLFYCTEAWQGYVGTEIPFETAYFTDATMTNNLTYGGIQNPYYFGIAADANQRGGGTLLTGFGESGTVDNGIVVTVHGGTAFVLGCNSTVFDITYTSANRTVVLFETRLSNDSTANIAQSVMANTDVASIYLQQAASLATFSSGSQELADKIAVAYSKAAMSAFSQGVIPLTVQEAQNRSTILVARVPAAPLFSLVVANMLFVLAGATLFAISLGSLNPDVRGVQGRLSIAGLIADRFEGRQARAPAEKLDDMFEERLGQSCDRVALEQAGDGGYEYRMREAARPTLAS